MLCASSECSVKNRCWNEETDNWLEKLDRDGVECMNTRICRDEVELCCCY